MMYRDSFTRWLTVLSCLLFATNASATGMTIGEGVSDYPEAETVSTPGDVNGDGEVTIADVTTLIDLLLNGGEMT